MTNFYQMICPGDSGSMAVKLPTQTFDVTVVPLVRRIVGSFIRISPLCHPWKLPWTSTVSPALVSKAPVASCTVMSTWKVIVALVVGPSSLKNIVGKTKLAPLVGGNTTSRLPLPPVTGFSQTPLPSDCQNLNAIGVPLTSVVLVVVPLNR